MGLHTATRLNRWLKRAEGKTVFAGRLAIGTRLILGFVFIILSMLAADAIILWQFNVVRTQARGLNDIEQKLLRFCVSILVCWRFMIGWMGSPTPKMPIEC